MSNTSNEPTIKATIKGNSMDIDTGELIKTVGILVSENQDLRQQVENLAKQNIRQAQAMRGADRALGQVLICDEVDGRIETICKMAQRKLARATTGTL